MDMVRVLAVGVLGTMLALTLGKLGGAQGLLVSIATGCVLLVMLLGQAEGLLAFARSLMGEGALSSAYVRRVLQVLGISCLTEAGSRICRDGGQGNIALKVELCGRVLMLGVIVPAVSNLLASATELLGLLAP